MQEVDVLHTLTNMSNEELEQFKSYVRHQSTDHNGDVSYPTMSGYLLGLIADLAMEFPQVSHKLMERVHRETSSK